MGLKRELEIAVSASQSGIRVNTDEIADALSVISETCKQHKWSLRVWDMTKGLQADMPLELTAKKTAPAQMAGLQAPPPQAADLGILDTLMYHLHEKPLGDESDATPVVVALKNFHLPFERQREVLVSAVQHLIEYGKSNGKFIVGLMPPEANLPPEIEPLFHVINHELPDDKELLEILDGLAGGEPLTKTEERQAVKAALGLTRLQAEGVFAASLATGGKVLAADVWKMKAEILNKEGLVELRETKVRFSDVGGLVGAKDFIMQLVQPDPLDEVEPDSRFKGVLLVGPPGTGKSLLAYCTGNEIGIPTLLVDMGKLKDQYVGNSEKRLRKMFQICRRMAPCVTVVDEVNLALGGGNGSQDHSVDRNMLGSFLTNLNDLLEPIFWMFTSNDVANMHEAIFRAERIDGKIYVRLPSPEQRAVIWKLNLKKFFPEKIGDKLDPRYVELDLDAAMLRVNKKTISVEDRVAYLATVLMAQTPTERAESLAAIGVFFNEDVATAVEARVVNDEGWTGAEIKSCCRLARRLKKTVFDTAKRIGHVCLGSKGSKMMDRLNRWATDEGALDSETGELYQPEEEQQTEESVGTATGGKFSRRNRRVRRVK